MYRSTRIHSVTLPRLHLLPFLFLILLLLLSPKSCHARQDQTIERSIEELDANDLRRIVQLDPEPWTSTGEGHLGRLLIPRPAGSQNNTDVRNYIKSVFTKLNWSVTEDPFIESTPIGDIQFTNLIASFDPSAPTKLVLAAHFDSKHFDEYPANQFIGATDSAAPCSTLLDLAESLTPLLRLKESQIREGVYGGDEEWAYTGLEMVFFDGEEAFRDWTGRDSIYGARHLAGEWDRTFLPDSHGYHTSFLSTRRYHPSPTTLSTIEHLILLDLLGYPEPRILSYYRNTGWLHRHLSGVEGRLSAVDAVRSEGKGAVRGGWFSGQGWGGMVDDDHRPFLERGVPILHLIANPFPPVWHTLADDASALDMPTLRRWNSIMRVFVVEYLGLPLPAASGATDRRMGGDELTGPAGPDFASFEEAEEGCNL